MTINRVQRLRDLLEEHHLPAMLVTNPYNRRYLTGFTGTSGYVLVTDADAILFTDFRYMEQAGQQAVHFQVIEHQSDPMLTIRDTLTKLNIKQIGFEQRHVTYGDYLSWARKLGDITLTPTDGLVEQLRMIKDEQELEVMRAAARIADQAFAEVLPQIRPGITEREIALQLEMIMRQSGASSSSFDTIVASGERSAMPHGVASGRKLQANEFVTLDFGAYFQGYCSDLTRTVILGQPTPKHREIYNIVLEAQMHALEHIKPGMTGKEADALTREVIKRYGYSDYFGHGTGHGIGLEIHEAPRLSVTGDTVLQPGMTVTVEPGIYLPGFGGVRIEDDVVVTATGVERLTQADKNMMILT
jgi:Xaa-Pro aminopeptidase